MDPALSRTNQARSPVTTERRTPSGAASETHVRRPRIITPQPKSLVAAGIADRSIVYYFPTKAELLTRTTFAVGEQLQELLDDAFGSKPLPGHQLLQRAWPTLARPGADAVFAVFFELVGLGAARIEPFDALAPAVMNAWIDWIIPRIDAPDEATARTVALGTLATLDGLLLLRQTLGPEAAEEAAAGLGLGD